MGVIKKQGITNTLISYTGIAIGFISLLIIQPKILSTEEIGLTRILFSFSSVVATLMPLGMVNVTIRFFPVFKNYEKKHYGFFACIMLFTFIGFLMVSMLLYSFKNYFIDLYSKESELFSSNFYYVFLLSFFLCFSTVVSSYCTANLKTTIPSFINDIYVRLATLTVFALYYFDIVDLSQMILLYVLVFAIQLLLLVLYTYSFEKIYLKIDYSFFKEKKIKTIIEYGLLFSVGVMSSLGLRYIDSVILGMFLPLSLVGVYAVCAFIPTMIEVPLTALEKISNPKIAMFWEENKIFEIEKTYQLSVRFSSIFASFIFLMIYVNIESLLSFLPNEYAQAKMAVIIISLGALTNSFTGINNSIIFFSKKYKTGLILLVSLLLLTIILDLLLIPKYGINGAALATASAAIIYNGAKYFYVKVKFKMDPFNAKHLLMIICLVTCIFIFELIKNYFVNGFLSMVALTIIFSFIFLISLFSVKITSFKELKNLIVEIIPKRN